MRSRGNAEARLEAQVAERLLAERDRDAIRWLRARAQELEASHALDAALRWRGRWYRARRKQAVYARAQAAADA